MRSPELQVFADGLIIDNFAGGGGASTGIELATGRSPDIAINHDAEALSVHEANHPKTRHIQTDVWEVDPVEATGGKPVALAWFSPDCTFFSRARGGKPFRDPRKAKRRRALAHVVVRWANAVHPRVIVMENVPEFEQWGPLDHNGLPIAAKQGFNFRRWCQQLRRAGYAIEWRQLSAHHFGAPTTRKRLFFVARCDGLPIVWPTATHGPGRTPYRTAAECIDWTLPCPSIFERNKPLAENTLRRIARGIQRYVIDSPKPFVVPLRGTSAGHTSVHDLADPLSTVSAGGTHHGLVMPYVQRDFGESVGSPADAPMPTITGGANGHCAAVAAFVAPLTHHGDNRGSDLRDPMPTVTGAHRGEQALVTPFLTEHANGSGQRNFDAAEPMRTQCANVKGGHFALVAPTMIQTGYGEREGQAPRSLDIGAPLGTVVSQGQKHALVSAFLAKHFGGHETPGSAADKPLDTVTSRDHHALVTAQLDLPIGRRDHAADVHALLVKFYGNEKEGASLQLPLGTVTTKDRFGLVVVEGRQYRIVDIGMRMLQPHELFAAQGFPPGYVIDRGADGRKITKTAQVRLCGNSVAPPNAAAIVRANLAVRASKVSAA